ncbi:MAG: Ig-like domain-containing protein [Desulfamplus sp.]|nr:Ig-like domain-containing protein [Desulfamplus sp.]
MKKSLTLFVCLFTLFVITLSGADVYSASKYESEPNENMSSATSINFGEQIVGKMWHALDYDWYAVNVNAAGTYNISAYYKFPEDATAVDDALLVELRDSSNKVITDFFVDYKDQDFTYSSNIDIPSTGKYYIVVHCPSQAKFKRDNYYLTMIQGAGTTSNGSISDRVQDMSLSMSQNSVKSDNSDKSDITATVIDTNRAPLKNVKVTFSITAGQITSSSAVTDDNGKAVVSFSSGHFEQGNQTVIITASVADKVTKKIPIQISGSTLTLDPGRYTSLEIDSDDTSKSTITILTLTAKDAGGNPIQDATITVSRDSFAAGYVQMIVTDPAVIDKTTGNPIITDTTTCDNTTNPIVCNPVDFILTNGGIVGKTDFYGNFSIGVKGFAVGDAPIKVEGLGDIKTHKYSVNNLGDTLRIIATDPVDDSLPPDDNIDLAIGGKPLKITAKVPAKTKIGFISTIGQFSASINGPWSNQQLSFDNIVGNKDVYFKSDVAGIASIYVLDLNNYNQNDSMTATIAASPEHAEHISLQASPTVIPPSSGGVYNVSDLVVTVKNSNDQPVANAMVMFSIDTPLGGGEKIVPGWALTDYSGVARSKFTSGSIPSGGNGIQVSARVTNISTASSIPPAQVSIVIGGTPGSIVIGRSSTISSDETNTHYILPMSILVSDAGGHPVANQKVSLNNWPTQYAKGSWVKNADDEWVVNYTSWNSNEDVNRNTILDPWENDPDGNGITPPNSSSGNVPETLSTDENGVANFNLVYLKHYAVWIEAQIRASTIVSGTETISELTFILPFQKGEEETLPSVSPFN